MPFRYDPVFRHKAFDAYNNCDLTTLGTMLSDALKHYHDPTGLSVGKAPFLPTIKQNICGKLERALLLDTLEVYPLKNCGAVEIGIHRFRHRAQPEKGVGDAKFINLWQLIDGTRQLTHGINYEYNKGLLANRA